MERCLSLWGTTRGYHSYGSLDARRCSRVEEPVATREGLSYSGTPKTVLTTTERSSGGGISVRSGRIA